MSCHHPKTKVLYDQGTPAEGRKLRGMADRCLSCGHIIPRPWAIPSEVKENP